MRFQIEQDGPLRVTEVSAVEMEFLMRIPEIAQTEDPAAKSRIFASPGGDTELEEDWEAFVRPELEELFEGALAAIESDLAGVRRGKGGAAFSISPGHWEDWLTGLNHARLVLWAEHRFTDSEMTEDSEIADPRRATAFFAMNLYGFLQEILLRVLGEAEEELGEELDGSG
jgi:hypothetical protein